MAEYLHDWDDGEDVIKAVFESDDRDELGEVESEFVDSLETKFESFGKDMFLSEKQYKWLKRIHDRIC